MAAVDTVAKQLEKFLTEAERTGLIKKMNDEHVPRFRKFLGDYAARGNPKKIVRDYRLQLAPFLGVFDVTHTLLVAQIGLLESWTSLAGNRDEVLAETGALLVGEDESEDAEPLKTFNDGFVKFFGAAGLPPRLKPEAVKKQLQEHAEAERKMPTSSAGQILQTARAERRRLKAEAKDLHAIMHDFLDGQFGRTGDAAYERKKPYAYDRRSLNARSRGGEKEEEEPAPVVPPGGAPADPAAPPLRPTGSTPT